MTELHTSKRLLAFLPLLLTTWAALAQPTLLSVIPGQFATDVSPTTTIQFTFNEAMNPDVTIAGFFAVKGTSYQMVTVTSAWSSGNKVLTCTPAAPLPAGYMVYWSLDGENTIADPLSTEVGYFTVSTGGSTTTGCDSSASMVSVTVSKGWMYNQSSAAAPVLNTNSPYCFLACMTIPCPRDATNVSLRAPLGTANNLGATGISGHLTFMDCSSATPDALDAFYGPGDYTFTIQAASSNQNIAVNFPSTLTQPAAPHIANWAAARAVDPTQPFTLTWDPLAGGSAGDCVYVEIYGGLFKTPTLGEAGALNGTAASVVIPAGTLQPNQTYAGAITFYHVQLLTNGTAYVSLAYRASTTEFELATSSGSTTAMVITNATVAVVSGKFTFEVGCSPGQIIVERSTNLQPGSWQPFYTTNATGNVVRISDDLAPSGSNLFYRARKGP